MPAPTETLVSSGQAKSTPPWVPLSARARGGNHAASRAKPWHGDAVAAALFVAVVLMTTGLVPRVALAQEAAQEAASNNAPAQAVAGPSPRLPGEVGPDTYLLPDKEGHLQRVLGFTYEDFLDAYKIQQQFDQAQEPPRFAVQRLVATGAAEDGHARLDIDITIVLNTEQSVGVPLGMPQALLLTPATVTGPGHVPVYFDTAAGGYVAWLHGKPGQSYHVLLHVLVPLTKTGDETALEIGMPRATASRLTLTVPFADATAQVGQGAAIVARRSVPEGTRWEVVGLGGAFRLAWRKATQIAGRRGTVLEASGAMLVRLDGFSVSTNVRLSVRSFGGRFDRFRVRLPAGADLVAVQQPGYTVTAVDPGGGRQQAASAAGQVVEVQLDSKTVGPIDVQLITQQRYPAAERARLFKFAGFEVIGAVRQFGHIAIQVIGDWHVQWLDRQGVTRVDQLPEDLQRDDVAAAFEYFHQPFTLSGRLIPRRTHVRVEPDYLILVGTDQARLDARLRYTVRVKKAFVLHINLAGWQLDPEEIGPPNLFDIGAVSITADGHVSIPLVTPTKGQIELTLQLRRSLPGGGGTIRLPLPVPQDVAPTPATVAVLPDDNVQLIPTPEGMTGLTPQQLAPAIKLPRRQQPPLIYRGDAEQARFAAQLRVHQQSVRVALSTQLEVDRRGAQVTQTLDYKVAYRAVDSLVLDLPREIARQGDLQIQLDNEPLPFAIDPAVEDRQDQAAEPTQAALAEQAAVETGAHAAATQSPAGPAGPNATSPESSAANTADAANAADTAAAPSRPVDRVRLQIALPEPTVGAFQVTLRYRVAWPDLVADDQLHVRVPLPEPVADVNKNRLSITPAATLQVAPRGDAWSVATGGGSRVMRRSAIDLVASGSQADIPLTLRFAARLASQSTIVERLWIQTWLTARARQDRAVYLLRTSATQLNVTLPEQVIAGDFMVLLDGVPIATDVASEGSVTIHLADPERRAPSNGLDRRHRLELRCLSHNSMPRLGSFTLAPAQLAGDIWVQHACWELILPRARHLIDRRGDFTDQWQWQWHRLGWRRVPVLTSAQLEHWSEAALSVRVPTAAQRYLFSSVGHVDRLTVRVADRSLLVLIASSGTLLAGLLLIYVPAVRQPRLLMAGVFLLLLVAVRHPDTVILFGQAGILGALLACLAAWLKRILARYPSRGAVLVSAPGSSVIGPISTTEAFAASSANGGSSAPTRRVITAPGSPSSWNG